MSAEYTFPTIGEMTRHISDRLERARVDSPRLCARLLVARAACHGDELAVLRERDRMLGPDELAMVEDLADRRSRGEPLAYLLGEREFYGRSFRVDSRVLVPRPETEHVVEEALRRFDSGADLHFADLGTGSGCLAVTLACELPSARGVAVDRSPGALAVAGANAAAHGVDDRVSFVLADFAHGLLRPGSMDLVVSNPPYVTASEMDELSCEVADYEPRGALLAGPRGDEALREVAARSWECLRSGGALIMEIGSGQGVLARKALDETGRWKQIGMNKDLAGLDRVVWCVK